MSVKETNLIVTNSNLSFSDFEVPSSIYLCFHIEFYPSNSIVLFIILNKLHPREKNIRGDCNCEKVNQTLEVKQIFIGFYSHRCCVDRNLCRMHLHIIATQYTCNNVLVEYIDNWTRSYSLVNHIPKSSKNNIYLVSHYRQFSNSTQIPS